MRTAWRYSIIFLINFILLVVGVAAIEFSYRLFKYASTCINEKCDPQYFSFDSPIANQNIGLTEFHPILGFVPKPGFDKNIELSNWGHSKVTITRQGYRSNDNDKKPTKGPSVLAAGDSFTFGNQVDNKSTWPSCLERESGLTVVNAGVPGYGAAQAVLRVKEILAEQKHFNLVIWSILVDDDIDRDKLMVRSSFVKPAVIYRNGIVGFSQITSKQNPINRQLYEPDEADGFLYLLKLTDRLLLFRELGHLLGYTERIDLAHPNAATSQQIIDFAFDEFNKLPASRKLVVLQYSKNNAHKPISSERSQLIDAARKRRLNLVDTRAVITSVEPLKVWNGHHTELGNKLVCEEILKEL